MVIRVCIYFYNINKYFIYNIYTIYNFINEVCQARGDNLLRF